MYTLNCQQCQKEFTTSTQRSKFCSRKCYWKSKERTEQRVCPICNKSFEVWPSEPNRFCSLVCRDIAKQTREERACLHCGKIFAVRPSETKAYCSLSCSAQVKNSTRKVAYPIRVCQRCGKEFEQKPRNIERKYCSRQCSDAINKNPPALEWTSKPCAYCGNLFLCPPWHPQVTHCSGKCAKQHQAQTVQGPAHPLWKDKIEMSCEVCGKICAVKPCIAQRFRACSKRCAAILSVQAQQRISSIEIKMQEALLKVGLEPTPQYIIGPYIADFAFPEHHLVVECDGDYWHGNPKQQAKDRRKDGYLNHNGWDVLRLPEHRILSNIDECVQEILTALSTV